MKSYSSVLFIPKPVFTVFYDHKQVIHQFQLSYSSVLFIPKPVFTVFYDHKQVIRQKRVSRQFYEKLVVNSMKIPINRLKSKTL